MRKAFYSLMLIMVMACNQNNSTKNRIQTDTLSQQAISDSLKPTKLVANTNNLLFKNITAVTGEAKFSTWVNIHGDTASCALHFSPDEPDTLSVEYSPECWLMFPFKATDTSINVYWDRIINTKYNFPIVVAAGQVNMKYIGKCFMILKLANDTTLKASYPFPELVSKLNNTDKDRLLFPDRFTVVKAAPQ